MRLKVSKTPKSGPRAGNFFTIVESGIRFQRVGAGACNREASSAAGANNWATGFSLVETDSSSLNAPLAKKVS